MALRHFYPGLGLGGHCIPIDPFYLSWKAKEYDVPTRFIELAGEVNCDMPQWVVHKFTDALNSKGKALKKSKILILGIAYKPNIDDDRESPSYIIWELLESKGATVHYHDPHVDIIGPTRDYPQYAGIRSVVLSPDAINSYDCVVICTKHDKVDYDLIAKHAEIIVDTRDCYNLNGNKLQNVIYS